MKQARETSKANVEDVVPFFDETGTQNEESVSSKSILSFEDILLQMIKRIMEKSLVDDFNEYWDIMKFLGEYLGIQDYTTNLYSSWILKAIAHQTVKHLNIIHEGDYTMFVQWLYEEIMFIIKNPDTTREEFFKLMSKTFYYVLSKILNGKGLSIPLKFFHPEFEEEEMEMSSIASLAGSVNIKKLTDVSEDIKLDGNTSESISQSSKLNYYENFLYAIIDATYTMFGSELNYTLIQFATNNEENVINFKIPYHFRKPKCTKKPQPTMRASEVSNISNSKPRKSRKSIKRNSSAPKERISESPAVIDTDTKPEPEPDCILPLAEAIESNDVMIYAKEPEEIKTDTDASKRITLI